MCDKLSDVDRARHEFASQGIFERRKTQYNLLLFYLGATGACLSVVLSSSQPETRVLVFLVPILLEIPIYTLWWYQKGSTIWSGCHTKEDHKERTVEEGFLASSVGQVCK